MGHDVLDPGGVYRCHAPGEGGVAALRVAGAEDGFGKEPRQLGTKCGEAVRPRRGEGPGAF